MAGNRRKSVRRVGRFASGAAFAFPLAAALLVVALALAGGATSSGADFTASSAATASITTAADFNTVTVSLTDPGTPLTGTISLAATASSQRGIATVKVQYAPTGTTDWVDVCTNSAAPYTCSLDTTTLPDQAYDFQAIATDTAGYTKTASVTNRAVDNFTLSVALTDPGAMSGNKTLTATATGAAPALASIKIQQRATGTSTWNDICTGAATPINCSLNTTAFTDGTFRDLRAVATDTGGHTAQSTVITRMIDNAAPTGTPTIPATGSGTVTMSATASDTGSGVAYVAWEAFYLGTWYEFCRDTTAPYTCSGDSATVGDGAYQTHIVIADNAGVKTTSPAQQIIIDNQTPAGVDIQTGNGGGIGGFVQTSDTITLTWSEPIAPASVVSGWTGSSRAIKVRIADGGATDSMEFYDGNDTTRLNLTSTAADLMLGGDYVAANTKFDATMAMSGNSITITLGSFTSGTRNTLVSPATTTLTWKPSALATDLSGHPSATTLVTESGTADLDF
jgi:chitinase